jgi:transcriptional regulator with XRE-family HTH domain
MSQASPTTDPAAALLRGELERRLARNPRYSLRAFAGALGISPANLSLVISGKRPVSRKTIDKVAAALGLSPDQRARLLIGGLAGGGALSGPGVPEPRDELSLDTFNLISDWYHLAILSVLELPGSSADAHWLAGRLGISVPEAKLAVDRLKRLGLIAERKGRWVQTGRPLRMENRVSTAATRRYHRQLLERAQEALESEPAESRDYTAMTLAVDARKIPAMRERITAFREALASEFGSQGQPERVYTLTVQLFPVSKPIPRKGGEKPASRMSRSKP